MKIEKHSLYQNDVNISYSLAQLKGQRLKMARALTGFSRQELYEKIGISASAMDAWETGRIELTEKRAGRVCASLKCLGIYCSIEWLLSGEGFPPRVMDDLEKSITHIHDIPEHQCGDCCIDAKNEKIPSFLNESIRRELSFFINLHDRAVFHIVNEDFLNSKYRAGDCIAGILESDISKLIDKIIIGISSSGGNVFGKLLNFSDKECHMFISSGKPSEKVDLAGAAEVIWHRMARRFN